MTAKKSAPTAKRADDKKTKARAGKNATLSAAVRGRKPLVSVARPAPAQRS